MLFSFHLPTKIFFGNFSLKTYGEELQRFGKKALIVSGKSSAVKSGALDELKEVLEKNGQTYLLFDEVEPNPSLLTVENGRLAADDCDFVIGVGGGSPLDAAKAIAVLATNELKTEELYTKKYTNPPLPIVALPLTAGTGSEVTPYAVLTYDEEETKKAFQSEDIFPKLAFLDPRYTYSLPYRVTLDTALDTLSHAIESYISTRANPLSDLAALKAMELIGKNYDYLRNGDFTPNVREDLLFASLLGGIAIAQTSTALIHTLGYNLTYYKNVPHGRANGLFLADYLKMAYPENKIRVENVLNTLNIAFLDEIELWFEPLLLWEEKVSKEEIIKWAEKSANNTKAKNNTPFTFSAVELEKILQERLL